MKGWLRRRSALPKKPFKERSKRGLLSFRDSETSTKQKLEHNKRKNRSKREPSKSRYALRRPNRSDLSNKSSRSSRLITRL